jgi:hypothetical protein
MWPDYYNLTDGGGIDWGSIIGRGIDVVGAAVSNSPYYSPDDPRYQQQGPVYYPQTGGGGQVVTTGQGGAGIHLSTNTLMLIAGGILIFLVARRR